MGLRASLRKEDAMAAVETQTRLMGGWNRRVWELDL